LSFWCNEEGTIDIQCTDLTLHPGDNSRILGLNCADITLYVPLSIVVLQVIKYRLKRFVHIYLIEQLYGQDFVTPNNAKVDY
jgi:hypothetical protein